MYIHQRSISYSTTPACSAWPRASRHLNTPRVSCHVSAWHRHCIQNAHAGPSNPIFAATVSSQYTRLHTSPKRCGTCLNTTIYYTVVYHVMSVDYFWKRLLLSASCVPAYLRLNCGLNIMATLLCMECEHLKKVELS